MANRPACHPLAGHLASGRQETALPKLRRHLLKGFFPSGAEADANTQSLTETRRVLMTLLLRHPSTTQNFIDSRMLTHTHGILFRLRALPRITPRLYRSSLDAVEHHAAQTCKEMVETTRDPNPGPTNEAHSTIEWGGTARL